MSMRAEVTDTSEPTEDPVSRCSNPTVSGNIVEETHVHETVRRQLLVDRGHTVGQLLADVGQVALRALVSQFELVNLGTPTKLANIVVHCPTAAESVACSVVVHVKALASASPVSYTHLTLPTICSV